MVGRLLGRGEIFFVSGSFRKGNCRLPLPGSLKFCLDFPKLGCHTVDGSEIQTTPWKNGLLDSKKHTLPNYKNLIKKDCCCCCSCSCCCCCCCCSCSCSSFRDLKFLPSPLRFVNPSPSVQLGHPDRRVSRWSHTEVVASFLWMLFSGMTYLGWPWYKSHGKLCTFWNSASLGTFFNGMLKFTWPEIQGWVTSNYIRLWPMKWSFI